MEEDGRKLNEEAVIAGSSAITKNQSTNPNSNMGDSVITESIVMDRDTNDTQKNKQVEAGLSSQPYSGGGYVPDDNKVTNGGTDGGDQNDESTSGKSPPSPMEIFSNQEHQAEGQQGLFSYFTNMTSIQRKNRDKQNHERG